MKRKISLMNGNGERITFEIGGLFSFFQILKIKKLLQSNEYSLATEEDAKIALELKLYN
ncbi:MULTISPECIES: hypothetical protein [Cetobacterium]|uniref:hypothetical protein n=1 Tax=Cetobacterium TaxID=180162 RepID=UPI0004199EA5|nr:MULTISPECIES: hypothetical protein [Cetobacterium]MBC2853569.1 hypothetical protein [Cetobacterium sp. 2G large]MCQ9626309.1 hypothetical protein [Cetobacterium somerae]